MQENTYKITIEGKEFNYQDIYCFQPIEEYDIKRNYNPFKMLYSYVFAPVLPINDILNDDTIKSNYVICTYLLINIWIKNKPNPIQLSFLPTEKKYIYVKSFIYKKNILYFFKRKQS